MNLPQCIHVVQPSHFLILQFYAKSLPLLLETFYFLIHMLDFTIFFIHPHLQALNDTVFCIHPHLQALNDIIFCIHPCLQALNDTIFHIHLCSEIILHSHQQLLEVTLHFLD